MRTFAIIGGGAAGISTLYQLVESLLKQKVQEEIRILLIEKSEVIGPGLAYSEKADDIYLLNLPYFKMSPVSKQEDHFSKWLHDENNLFKWRPFFPELDLNISKFPPRRLFGIYLTDLAVAIQNKAKVYGIQINFIQDEAINITPHNKGGLELQLKNKHELLHIDSAVLCIGHLPPYQPGFEKFKAVKWYYQTPWEIKPEEIPIEEDVIILGTRLSAIDTILSRAAYIKKCVQAGYQGPVGKIIAASRTGLPPRVLGDTKQDYVRNELTLEAIDAATAYGTQPITFKHLKKMFKAEIKRAYLVMRNQQITLKLDTIISKDIKRDPISWLEYELECVQKHAQRPWQTVLFSLYPVVPRLWEALDKEGKKEFLEKYYTFWMTYLAAFPAENAEKILALLKSGQLEMYRGLEDLAYHQDTHNFEVKLKEGKSLQANYIINATGQGHDITQTDSLLLKNLLANKLIKPHSLGGIKVDFKSLRAMSEYGELPIFIVGDPTWGACMATADLCQIANHQVPRVINSMLSVPKKKHSVSLLIKEKGIFANPLAIKNNISHESTPAKDENIIPTAASNSCNKPLSQTL